MLATLHAAIAMLTGNSLSLLRTGAPYHTVENQAEQSPYDQQPDVQHQIWSAPALYGYAGAKDRPSGSTNGALGLCATLVTFLESAQPSSRMVSSRLTGSEGHDEGRDTGLQSQFRPLRTTRAGEFTVTVKVTRRMLRLPPHLCKPDRRLQPTGAERKDHSGVYEQQPERCHSRQQRRRDNP